MRARLPGCSLAYFAYLVCLFVFAHLGAQATTTLTATPCRCGRNVARPSSSKTKVPPGLMAWVVRIRSLASHATVQAWRHSPSTKRMTVPLGPTGPGGPAAPGGPCSPFSPWGPATCFSSQAESAKSANSRGIINTRTCMGGALPRYPAGYAAQEVKILLRRVKRVSAMPAGQRPQHRGGGVVAAVEPELTVAPPLRPSDAPPASAPARASSALERSGPSGGASHRGDARRLLRFRPRIGPSPVPPFLGRAATAL